MDFQTCLETLKFFEISVIRESEYREQPDGTRQPIHLDLLSRVKLPLDAEEWCALCMRDGTAYLGGCCATLSGAQDLLHKAFMDTGWMPLTDLKAFVEIVTEHGDVDFVEYPFDTPHPEVFIAKAKTEWENMGPIDKIAVTWHVARGHMTSKIPQHIRHDSEAETALQVLHQGIRHLNAHFLVSRVLEPDKEPSPVQLVALYRLWPSLKTAYENFQSMDTGPMTGWAFVNPEAGPEALASGEIGTSFYPTLEEIKELVAEWNRSAEQHQDVWGQEQRERFKKLGIRKVRVSAEHGIEFLPGEVVPVMSLV